MTAPDHNSCEAEIVRRLPAAADAAGPVERACRLVADGRRAARALTDWTRHFELSEPEFQVLWCLRDVTAEGLDQTTIAQWLALSPAQVSATVERLRAQGWIVQHARSGDRRRRLWHLSADGRTKLALMLRDVGGLRLEPDGREVAA